MDIFGIPLWLYLLTLVVGLAVYYMWYMSMDLNVFEKMGVDGPGPMPVLGNLGHVITSGLYQSQVEMYAAYKHSKVFGVFDSRTPCLVVTDLSIIKEILNDHFDNFPNRQRFLHGDSILHHSLPLLRDDQWRRVKTKVNAALKDGGLLKEVPRFLEKRNEYMMAYLKEQMEDAEEIDVRELADYYNMDFILRICFGIEANSFQDPDYSYMFTVGSINSTLWYSKMVHFFFPFLWRACRTLGICSCEKAVRFINKLTDSSLSRKEDEEHRDTLLHIISEEDEQKRKVKDEHHSSEKITNDDQDVSTTSLSERDIKGQAFSLTLSSYNTVPSVMSFTLFMLANNTDCCRKVQEEIDAILELNDSFNSENVRKLTYLDMCIKETMRMFPTSKNIDRVCVEDVTIQGFTFPKGMPVFIPVHAIHNDPEIWSDPQEFRPERFSAENATQPPPFAFLPFGDGPRKCVGLDLALLEMKIGIATILRKLTPAPCYNTIYPIKLCWYSNKATDVLWVRMDERT